MADLGRNELAGLVALNAGIALATLFSRWPYQRFGWVTPRGDSWQRKETRCATGISTTSTAST